MQVELSCPCCRSDFLVPEETPAQSALAQVASQGPWFSMGDGETLEDMLFAALTRDGAIRCPDCDTSVEVSEEGLGRLTMQLLAQW